LFIADASNVLTCYRSQLVALAMARIARRSLRIRELPLFSLGKPWQSVSDSGRLDLRLFEPRYMELGRRVLPPNGDGKFGYSDEYPPRAGGSGMLAQTEGFRWTSSGKPIDSDVQLSSDEADSVLLSASAATRFRILAVRAQEVASEKPPLYVAHVQLLEDRDTLRRADQKALGYWESRWKDVQQGTALIAKQGAPVYESIDAWRVSGEVPAGVLVIAGGPPRLIAGYMMVPIVPSGAIELALFRDQKDQAPGDTMPLPTGEDIQAALLNMGKEVQSPSGFKMKVSGRRKSQRRERD